MVGVRWVKGVGRGVEWEGVGGGVGYVCGSSNVLVACIG